MNIKIEQIEMLGNRILIKPDPAKVNEIVAVGGLVTASGKQLTNNGGVESIADVEPPTGTIAAVGGDCKILQVGDRVLYSPFGGKRLTFLHEDYILMSEPEPVLRITN